jgi:hypothetical protein
MGERHNERCRDCKQSVRNLLAASFGTVEVNWDLCLPCNMGDYKDTLQNDVLGKIYEALQTHRGFCHFVKSKKLPRVNFFIPSRSLIVEFDETQHFTKPRDIALGLYPSGLRFCFSVEKWRALCRKLNKRDNDPPYRDEQRAWYDTLRDFAPLLSGGGQVARLYSRDFVWCSLNPANRSHLDKFRTYLGNSR